LKGQGKKYRKEIVSRKEYLPQEIFSNKKLELTEEDILRNVQIIQKEQSLKPNSKLAGLHGMSMK